MSGPAKCPTCGRRLEGVQPQRLRTRGAAPAGAQLYVAPCPRCNASVPFATATANAMAFRALANLAPERAPSGRRRALTVHQIVRVLLAARD
jgi:endogenous inhibitor of DNA gyrase (YacG/DUF329 family)